MKEYIGKHEKVDLDNIPESRMGESFHGEVWVRCPHCDSGNELMGATPLLKKDNYLIFRCSRCGKLFKD